MRRTSPLLYAGQILTAPLLRQRSDPDRAFERLYESMRATMDGFAFLEEPVAQGFRRRLRAYAATEGLSGLGWRIALDSTAHRMSNRMRVAKLHAANPDLASVPIADPIVVAGLPRTGTTLSSVVLAGARECRGPELWEMFDMAVPGSRSPEGDLAVQHMVDKTMRTHLRFSPDWDLIHPMRARAVEENAFLMDHSVMDLGTAPMPGYWDYLTGKYDAGYDWRFVKQALQVLSAGREPRRWVLKHPGNLYYLPEMFEVFPDAQVVVTHRDPATVLGSMCSMAESLHYLHMRASRVDPRAIGRTWLRLLPYGVEKSRRDRVAIVNRLRQGAKGGARAFVDLAYARLNADPYREVPQLFERLGLAWGPDEEANLGVAMARPKDGRRHDYGMRHYGVTEEDIDAAFGPDYMNLLRSMGA